MRHDGEIGGRVRQRVLESVEDLLLGVDPEVAGDSPSGASRLAGPVSKAAKPSSAIMKRARAHGLRDRLTRRARGNIV